MNNNSSPKKEKKSEIKKCKESNKKVPQKTFPNKQVSIDKFFKKNNISMKEKTPFPSKTSIVEEEMFAMKDDSYQEDYEEKKDTSEEEIEEVLMEGENNNYQEDYDEKKDSSEEEN